MDHWATDGLVRWGHNIHMIPQLIQNDVSSTKARLFFEERAVREICIISVAHSSSNVYRGESCSLSLPVVVGCNGGVESVAQTYSEFMRFFG